MKVNIKIKNNETNNTQKKIQKAWPDLWKQQLIKRNNQILQNIREKKPPPSNQLWQAACSGKTIVQIHNYTLQDHSQGPYSHYLPLAHSMSISNEIDNCIPYFQHLSSQKSEQYQVQLFEITKRMSSPKQLDQWKQIYKQYGLGIGLFELIHIYLQVLAKGTPVLNSYSTKYQVQAKYLAFQVFQLGKLFTQKTRIYTNKIEVGQKINLDNMSKTFKLLFCQICNIYDCNKHNISETAVIHNYRYTCTYQPETRFKEKKETVLSIMEQISRILSNDKSQKLQNSCSTDCYKLLAAEKWQGLLSARKKKTFSYVFRVYIQMGIQLFSFDPCKIKQLFGKRKCDDLRIIQTNIKCCDVFYYFLHDFDIKKKLEYKFQQNQAKYLKNQPKEVRNCQPIRNKKRLKNKSKTQKQTQDAFNAVCFHYFTNCEPQDIGCFNCECRKRGYCLPSCQCSDLCMLQLKGCKCKASASECLSNCVCYRQKRACIPEICQCFHSKNSKLPSWCENSQIAFSSQKLTRIGQSTIDKAGLGLFAGEFIRKGEFVIKYVGEIIQSESLQKLRQNLTQKEGHFYNFKLDNNISLDSRYFGNKSRFINHSFKNENLRVEKIKLREESLLIFRAIKDIEKNEQLFFDYNGGGALTEHKDKFPFIQQ